MVVVVPGSCTRNEQLPCPEGRRSATASQVVLGCPARFLISTPFSIGVIQRQIYFLSLVL